MLVGVNINLKILIEAKKALVISGPYEYAFAADEAAKTKTKEQIKILKPVIVLSSFCSTAPITR